MSQLQHQRRDTPSWWFLTNRLNYDIVSGVPQNAVIPSFDEDPLVSTSEAGQILGVTAVTIQRWAREGVIASQKMPGKTGAYVLRRSEVKRLADERATS